MTQRDLHLLYVITVPQLLLYVVDASASEKGRSPAHDLTALAQELSLYDPSLLDKPALVFANKYDLDGE